MPQRPLKPCRHRGCRELTRNGNGYCDPHKDDAKAWVKRPALKTGRGGRKWSKLRLQILVRDLYQCQCAECKKREHPLPADEVDHIVPLSQGGTDAPNNLRAMNRECHREKTQREAMAARVRV